MRDMTLVPAPSAEPAGEIPKRIHYVWVGPRPFPEDAARRVEDWKVLLPDYTFTLWTEQNIDFRSKFIREAYAVGAYNRVANYVRAQALYNHGGIYMDHDVELLQSFDRLRDQNFFIGFQTLDEREHDAVNNAVMGSMPKHRFLRRVLDVLDSMDGTHNWGSHTGPGLISRLLRDEGELIPTASIQRFGDITIFPPCYFYPYGWTETFSPSCIMDDTIAIHHWEHTWRNKPRPKLRERLIAAGLRRGARLSPTIASLAVRASNAVSRSRRA